MESVASAENIELSDADLMQRVQRGDVAAFTTLVDRFKNPVLALVCRVLKDSSDAEDIAQQVFVQVYKSKERYRATAKFSTWLFTIAKNLCLNELRRRSRHPTQSLDAATSNEDASLPGVEFVDSQAPAPLEVTLSRELSDKIQEVLNELPDNQRIAMELWRQEESSYEDISSILDCSVAATKSLIHRARETLRTKLKAYLVQGDWER